MQQPTKILALDVEGTIITGYDYNNVDPNGTYPAIISPKLADILKKIIKKGFIIVTATGTDGNNLEYYKKEFGKANIAQYINSYSPAEHKTTDTKADKLNKYAKQFNVTKENIYFFDDAKNNVEGAKQAGFQNCYQVTEKNSLQVQLSQLLSDLDEQEAKEIQTESDDSSRGEYSLDERLEKIENLLVVGNAQLDKSSSSAYCLNEKLEKIENLLAVGNAQLDKSIGIVQTVIEKGCNVKSKQDTSAIKYDSSSSSSEDSDADEKEGTSSEEESFSEEGSEEVSTQIATLLAEQEKNLENMRQYLLTKDWGMSILGGYTASFLFKGNNRTNRIPTHAKNMADLIDNYFLSKQDDQEILMLNMIAVLSQLNAQMIDIQMHQPTLRSPSTKKLYKQLIKQWPIKNFEETIDKIKYLYNRLPSEGNNFEQSSDTESKRSETLSDNNYTDSNDDQIQDETDETNSENSAVTYSDHSSDEESEEETKETTRIEYAPIKIILAADRKSVGIFCQELNNNQNLVKIPFDNIEFGEGENKVNLHPIVKNYLNKADNSPSAILTLLYQLNTLEKTLSAEEKRKIIFIQHKPTLLTIKPDVSITSDSMITKFCHAHGIKKISFTQFQVAINKILDRYGACDVTAKKLAVFENFVVYYQINKYEVDLMPWHKMVLAWAKSFQEAFRENPFEILAQQRSHWFKTDKTNSIKLFEQLMAGETIPPELSDLIYFQLNHLVPQAQVQAQV